METETPSCWSELPFDLIACIFQQLSFLDIQRAKIVCSNRYSASKHRVIKKKGSSWLMLFPKKSNCVLYNPQDNEFYKPLIDYSGFRFLANSGKWFLVVTPDYNLCIVDLFSSERIDLPPLESLVFGNNHSLQRVEDKKFRFVPGDIEEDFFFRLQPYDVDSVRGLLWVDEKNKANYVVVWYFYCCEFGDSCNIAFCKNGYNKYVDIPIRRGAFGMFVHAQRMLLGGYKLYVYTAYSSFRILDLSGETFQDVTQNRTPPIVKLVSRECGRCHHITVTLSGEVLLVCGFHSCLRRKGLKISKFKVYKDGPELDPKNYCKPTIDVESLGSDEALLIDLGVTTSVEDIPGVEPNSIYFTRLNIPSSQDYNVQICVFNLATKTRKYFPNLSAMPLKDARWFIPNSRLIQDVVFIFLWDRCEMTSNIYRSSYAVEGC